MKNESCCADKGRAVIYVLTILGTFLIVAWLVWMMVEKTRPAPLGADRSAERRKNLADLRAADHAVLYGEYAWQDQGKALVRLPIERAMALTVQEWQNPAAARSNLIARVEKATAPAPKAPEKPSEYE